MDQRITAGMHSSNSVASTTVGGTRPTQMFLAAAELRFAMGFLALRADETRP